MNSPITIIPKHATPRDGETWIDPRAAVSPEAELGVGCTVLPFAVIGAGVQLGDGCIIHPHAVIEGPCVLGSRNEVHPFACIGGPPQDLRYRGEPTKLTAGNDNIFRELATVNRGTAHGGGETVIGNHNLFMASSHVAHDCKVGDHVVMANHATVAGHTVIGDFAVFGGMVGVATFLRIGESAMLAAGALVEREVPPFCIVAGDRARLRAVNRVGLERRGIDRPARRQIKQIFRALKRREMSPSDIVRQLRSADGAFEGPVTPEAHRMLDFLSTVTRGVTR